jgi:hypothetical protein
MKKDSINNVFCSQEQLEKFKGKVCIWNLAFMDRPLTGKLAEVNPDYFLIEMRDGRMLVARLDCVVGFGMAKHQPEAA